ncbi:hypothetical protein PtB15_11B388 [Puccinia triticina]|nr:hypothetical protein PtB15_11B388 [Puccinia triticina]
MPFLHSLLSTVLQRSFEQNTTQGNEKIKRVANSYLLGFKKIQKEIAVDPLLSRFKLHMPCSYDLGENEDEEMADPTEEIPRYEL